jgi:ferric-dicitrate binding protein FerR (iron transport regulator)
MSKEAFYSLLERYQQGTCTEEEKRIVEQWYGILDDHELPDITEAELSAIDSRQWAVIEQKLQERKAASRKKARRVWTAVAWAASLVGILAIAGYSITLSSESPAFISENKTSVIRKENSGRKSLTVLLPDSSTVVLQPGATLSYPSEFTPASREVVLTGEAFFEVTKDQTRPFLVFSNDIVTRVVGTSFVIKTGRGAESEVAVLTGKVIVTQNEDHKRLLPAIFNKPQSVTLTPNHRAIYKQAAGTLTVALVEKPVEVKPEGIAPASGYILDFNEAPMTDVLKALEYTYGISIQTEYTGASAACKFTGDLRGQDLYAMLELVCRSVGATYTIQDTTIRISGGDCIP